MKKLFFTAYNNSVNFFVKFVSPFSVGIEVDQREFEISKLLFKRTEAIFKVASWITIVGVFKFISVKTNSWSAMAIYAILNGTLFGYLLSLIEPYNIRILQNTSQSMRTINFIIILAIFVAFFFYILQPMMNSIVKDIIASK